MVRVALLLMSLGLGLTTQSQAPPGTDFAFSPHDAATCPPGPLAQSNALNYQTFGTPLNQRGLDGNSIMVGDFLGSGGRQLCNVSVDGTIYFYQSDGSQLPGFPSYPNSCIRPPSPGFPDSCAFGVDGEAALPLQDDGSLVCSMRWRRNGSLISDITKNIRFMKPDGSFLGWAMDVANLPPPTDPYYSSLQLNEVTGTRLTNGQWAVYASAGYSNEPLFPRQMLQDKTGSPVSGWPRLGTFGYPFIAQSTFVNGTVFHSGDQTRLFPNLGLTNYGLTMLDNGQPAAGNPYSVTFSGYPQSNATIVPVVARIGCINYIAVITSNYYSIVRGINTIYLDGISIYTENGTLLPGWPQPASHDDGTGMIAGMFVAGLALGDLDGDGIPEIVAESSAGLDNYMALFAWHLDGSLVAGFPVRIPGAQGRSQPTIGDIDGDGMPEILFTGSTYCGTSDVLIFAYHNNGTPVNLFPMNFNGTGDPGSVQEVTLDDFNGDGKLDLITSPDRNFGSIYVITLNTPYNRDNIEWPTFQFDVMRTGWYRKMAHVDKAASWLETSAPAIPGDGQSSVWITAHGIRPNSQPILWPDQFVRFGRLPDIYGNDFSTFTDNGNGSWSQKLTAPYVQDPVTVTVKGWINEFLVNQTVNVTFWGQARLNTVSPRIFPTGSFIDPTLTGANFGPGVTLRALDPDLTISNVIRVSETGLTARFSVPAGAIGGPRYFVANAYGRDSAPQWVLAYDPNDLFLVLDKTAGTTLTWYGRASPNYTLMRDTTPTFATGAPIYNGPAMTTTDPAINSYFYLIFAP